MMGDWLADHLKTLSLTADVEDYVLGRGTKETTILSEGMKTWALLPEPSPDPAFREMCGKSGRGERLEGMLTIPVRSPRGQLLGIECRDIHQKRILDYRLPAAKFSPFFIGTRSAMPAIWAGGDVWLVEGVFDKTALEWAVPARDAVLACVRAHLTHQQIEFLRRFCRGWVHVAFDRDETGRKAITGWTDEKTGKWRRGAIELLEGVGLRATDVKYEGGKDPGEIWDKGGERAIRAAFAR